MNEDEARVALATHGRSLFMRGYSPGTSGNLSVRLSDGRYLVTPTNVSLGAIDPAVLSLLDADGRHVAGQAPTKEVWLHLAVYGSRPGDAAVVHLHSTHAVALSCRTDRPDEDMLPPLTPYVVMRVGRVARVPYARPGDPSATDAVAAAARGHRAVLLANHGPVVSAPTIEAAVAAAEELEETARLFFLLDGRPHATLTAGQVDDLHQAFGR
jgi:3-dehydro-4-phosphotetronate decarboxylase